GGYVNFALSAGDNCGVYFISCSQDDFDLFPVGDTTVCCTAYDYSFNPSQECCFNVHIDDCEPPTLSCNNVSNCNFPGFCSNFVDFDYSANDNCGVFFVDCSNYGPFGVGDTTVCCTAY